MASPPDLASPHDPSEYDPLFGTDSLEGDPLEAIPSGRPGSEAPADDMARVEPHFAAASRPYLSSPGVWLAWAVLLPAAALLTPTAARLGGPAGVLMTWSVTILLGGLAELPVLRSRPREPGQAPPRGPRISRWAFRVQGNLSLLAVLLSVTLLWIDAARLLPGLWLLLLGHSLYTLGGLAFRPMATSGLLYQVGGATSMALALTGRPWGSLVAFAVATGAANLWLAYGVWRRRGAERRA